MVSSTRFVARLGIRAVAAVIAAFGLSAAADGHGGDPAAGQAKSATCAACHGQDGRTSLLPEYPNIAGQNERYLYRQLQMFKSGQREMGLMAGQLAMFEDDDLADLAAYYASLPGAIGDAKPDALALGEQIYRGGILDKGVAACTACHAPTGAGNAPAGFPRLSGQSPAYTAQQLVKYREGLRQTDEEYGGMMRDVASNLTDTEIRAVANYVLGLH